MTGKPGGTILECLLTVIDVGSRSLKHMDKFFADCESGNERIVALLDAVMFNFTTPLLTLVCRYEVLVSASDIPA